MARTKKLYGTIPLLFVGNCGSSWIESELASHPAISAPVYEPLYNAEPAMLEAFFKAAFEDGDKQRLFDLLGEIANAKNQPINEYHRKKFWSAKYFCFKLRPWELPKVWENYFPTKTPLKRLIWIRRLNLVKQALSEYKRFELDISQFTRKDISEAVTVDPDKFAEYLMRSRKNQEIAEAKYQQCSSAKTILDYETALSEFENEMARICEFLEVPRESLHSGYFAKVTSNDLHKAIANYNELFEFVAFHPDLSDLTAQFSQL
jgi:hypothetical protein